jgi:hypothetical protein
MRSNIYIVSLIVAFLTLAVVNQASADIAKEYPLSIVAQNPCFVDSGILPVYVVNHDQSGNVMNSGYRCPINKAQAEQLGLKSQLFHKRAWRTMYRKVSIPSDTSLIPYVPVTWSVDNSGGASVVSDCLSSSYGPISLSDTNDHQIIDPIRNVAQGNYVFAWSIGRSVKEYSTSYYELKKVKQVRNCHIREIVQGDKLLIKTNNELNTVYEISLPSAKLILGRITPFAKTKIYVPLRPYFMEYYRRPVKFTVTIDSPWRQCRKNRKVRVSANGKRSATIRLRGPQNLIQVPKRFFNSGTFVLRVMRVDRRGGTCGQVRTRLVLKPRINRPQPGGGAPPQHGFSVRPYLTGGGR